MLYCCCSITKLCPTLCTHMDRGIPGFPVSHHLPESAQVMSTESVMPNNHLISCLLCVQSFPVSRLLKTKKCLPTATASNGIPELQVTFTAFHHSSTRGGAHLRVTLCVAGRVSCLPPTKINAWPE